MSSFIEFFSDYTRSYNKKDIRVMKQAFRRYNEFLADTCISEDTPSPATIRQFVNYLSAHSRGGGAASTFARFKKAMTHALECGIMDCNPCKGIRCHGHGDDLVKDILSTDEIRRLTATHYPGESTEIRLAFIFCLYTGIRFCDVKVLKFNNIDYNNSFISFYQVKTQNRSSRSRVYIPLRQDIIKMLGRSDSSDSLIFNLPSHTSCLKHLKRWTDAAGIDKHITWHCARHSFATNILQNGANIRVIAELLGHSSLKYVERYTRVIDKVKRDAVESLPSICD